MANKNLHVYVVHADGELRVVPATITADGSGNPGNRDKLVIHNETTEDMLFCFGKGAVDSNNRTFLPVDSQSISAPQEVVSKGNGRSELFIYQAIAYKSGKKAKGNSDPVLIIEN